LDVVTRDDFSERGWLEDRRLALPVVERLHERPSGVLLGSENTRALLRAFADLRRIRAEERGGTGDGRPVVDREMQGDVMPLHAPAPHALRRRRAEDADVVLERIAREAASAGAWITGGRFDPAQHILERHDRRSGHVALLAEARFHQIVRELALRF